MVAVFHGKKLTSATFEPLRKGACQTIKEIAFQFSIGVEIITTFKLKKKRKFMH